MCDGKFITDKQNVSYAINLFFFVISMELQSQLEDCMLTFKDDMPAKIQNDFFLTNR